MILDGIVERPFTLIWGGPGTGKHDLVESALVSCGLPVWQSHPIAVDPGTDAVRSGVRFRITDAPTPGPIREVSDFVMDWKDHPRDGVLVLDGGDLESTGWKDALPPGFLWSPPSGLHVVFLARSRPRLPIQKLVLSGALVEIGHQDLSLGRSETFELIRNTGISDFPEETCEAIHRLSQGWIAGTILCSLHVRSFPDPLRATDTLAENPKLAEYLEQEILQRLPGPSSRTLIDLSILSGGFPPELGDSILERTDSTALLSDLAERLPMIQRTGDGNWQFHPLLAAGLSERLRLEDAERYKSLHRRSARWFHLHGQAHPAIRHALEARDPEILESVAERALQNLFRNSEFFALQKHVREISPGIARDRPFLSVFLAWALFHMGREHEGVAHLDHARTLALDAERQSPRNGRIRAILSHEAFLRSILLRLRGSVQDAQRLAKEAYASCPDNKPFLAASLRSQMAINQFLSGDLDDAEEELERSMEQAESAEHHLAYFGSGYTRTEIMVLRGRLDSAHQLIADQRRYAETGSARGRPVSGYMEIARSRVLLQEGNLLDASEAAERGILLGLRCDNIRILNYGLASRAEIAALSNDLDSASRALDEAEAVSRRTRMHWAIDLDDLEAKRIRLLLPRLSPSTLNAWITRTLPKIVTPCPNHWDEFRTAMRLLTCLGRAEDALRLGRTWKPFLEGMRLTVPLLEAQYLSALASGFMGRTAEAIQHLDSALGNAATSGAIAPFLHGPELAGIRREIFSAWSTSPLARDGATRALASRLASIGHRTGNAASRETDHRSSHILSDREAEVLRAIRRGCSNKEIADALFVAESTIKTHLKNIFVKLNVSNRTQAVSLASDANMI
ncbi:MAG: hypothetical protein IPK50_12550 [Fibrobacterota bacterium]|nr:MAG: hypothetical protein IPK50_12550 [Fibrobacterota bacterium]